MSTWFRSHLSTILAVLGVLSVVCTFINARLPRDAEGHVTRPKSWGEFIWRALVDLLALVPQPGKAGLLGPVNVPGMPSLGTKPGEDVLRVLLVVGLGGMLWAGAGGCATTPITRAHLALTTAADIGGAAYKAIDTYDAQLDAEEKASATAANDTTAARAKLADWRPKRAKALAAVHAYAAAILAWQVALQTAEGLKSGAGFDAIAFMQGIARAASDLLDALRGLGVALPNLPKFSSTPSNRRALTLSSGPTTAGVGLALLNWRSPSARLVSYQRRDGSELWHVTPGAPGDAVPLSDYYRIAIGGAL